MHAVAPLMMRGLLPLLALSCAISAFPAYPTEGILAIVEPSDMSTVFAAPHASGAPTADISLRYALHRPGAEKLCLQLQLDGQAYAKGCYALGQPVTLQRLRPGRYVLRAAANTAAGVELADATSHFSVVASSSFSPTYEWTAVKDDESVPPGLEVRLELHKDGEERHRLARIPPAWRLQLVLGSRHGFFRTDVTRTTTVSAIEAEASAYLRGGGAVGGGGCVELWDHGSRLPPEATAEAVDLFGRRGGVLTKLKPPCQQAGDEGAAHRRRPEVESGAERESGAMGEHDHAHDVPAEPLALLGPP